MTDSNRGSPAPSEGPLEDLKLTKERDAFIEQFFRKGAQYRTGMLSLPDAFDFRAFRGAPVDVGEGVSIAETNDGYAISWGGEVRARFPAQPPQGGQPRDEKAHARAAQVADRGRFLEALRQDHGRGMHVAPGPFAAIADHGGTVQMRGGRQQRSVCQG